MINVAALLICLSPTAIDGDTLRCGDTAARVRLYGVSSAERDEPGGTKATAALAALIRGGLICEVKGGSFSRTVAICYNSANVDIGKDQLNSKQAAEDCLYSRNYYGTCS